MRVVYCHDCGAVSAIAWSEQDRCPRCGHSAELMDYHRPWQYYASTVAMLAAAALFVWGPIQDLVSRLLILVAVLVVALALSSWGLRSTRAKVLKEIAARKAAEEQA